MSSWIFSYADEVGVAVGIATLLLSLATLAFAALRFVTVRRDEQLQVEFENYHKLIAQFVGSERATDTMKLDSQVAIVFELTRFKRYRPVTARIIKGLKEEWENNGSNNSRLIEEMKIALQKLS